MEPISSANPFDRRSVRLEADHAQQLADAHHAIVSCDRCPRLRAYCTRIASEKKRAYRDDTYWGRPVPGFGDPAARLLLVGLAPAAHGANRTGRVFTGDGTGGSGDFLMAALHRTGFANIPTSSRPDDGLQLTDAYIAAAVRCAPPDNKPLPEEITRCLDHLESEIAALPNVRVVVALGKIAFDAWLQLLRRRGGSASGGSRVRRNPPHKRPEFGHGVIVTFEQLPTLIGCYHPSRQNTNTGKLTPRMMVDVFRKARKLL
ncbi:MAG: uracil-DNA glycosylase [Vicinamibacterales bacterium]